MEDKRRRRRRRWQEGLLAFGSLPLLLCDEARTMDGTQLVTQKEVSAPLIFLIWRSHTRARPFYVTRFLAAGAKPLPNLDAFLSLGSA
jgi:hypothetical protein